MRCITKLFMHSIVQNVMNHSNLFTSQTGITPVSKPCKKAIVSTSAVLVGEIAVLYLNGISSSANASL